MNLISQHPNEDILLDYHNGRLPITHNIVIAAHIELCAHCRKELRFYDEIGGVLLEEAEMVPMNDDALDLALARIERPYENEVEKPLPQFLEGFELPNAIKALEFKNRYYAAPGVWLCEIDMPKQDQNKAYLMHVKAGMQMPLHDHRGKEFTMVLKGHLSDSKSDCFVGDFMDAEAGFAHSPMIENDDDCLCIIACEDKIIPQTLLGKMLQPFARI